MQLLGLTLNIISCWCSALKDCDAVWFGKRDLPFGGTYCLRIHCQQAVNDSRVHSKADSVLRTVNGTDCISALYHEGVKLTFIKSTSCCVTSDIKRRLDPRGAAGNCKGIKILGRWLDGGSARRRCWATFWSAGHRLSAGGPTVPLSNLLDNTWLLFSTTAICLPMLFRSLVPFPSTMYRLYCLQRCSQKTWGQQNTWKTKEQKERH